MSNLVPLRIGLINEGRFVGAGDECLGQLQRQLLRHITQHGLAAEGAKAKLTLETTLQVESCADKMITVASKIKFALPSPPTHVTRALGDETDDGQLVLLVRSSGSTADTPNQGVLTTEDGREIDPATGEVLDDLALPGPATSSLPSGQASTGNGATTDGDGLKRQPR